MKSQNDSENPQESVHHSIRYEECISKISLPPNEHNYHTM